MKSEKRIFILGGGAVGSSFAAALSQSPDNKVTLIGREAHVNAIKLEGLKLTGKINKTFKFEARTDIEDTLEDALLIVTLKAVSLKTGLQNILHNLTPSTSILLTQNGWGIKDLATETLKTVPPISNIYTGIVGMGANFETPGTVECWGGNILVESSFQKTRWHDIFKDMFIEYRITENIEKAIWRKLIINSLVNPLSVLLNAKNSTIGRSQLNPIKAELLNEALKVAEVYGIDTNLTLDKINQFIISPNYTSMYQDIKKGRKTEIDFINGAIVELGREKGIETPNHKLISLLIKSLENLPQ